MDSKLPETEVNAPDTQTVRLRFSRGEPAVWLAHLDLMRTFERSIRRASLPVAYSKGFNPRPHLAFALPIGVGLATRDDYVDISLTEPVAPEELMNRLNCFLPAGLTVLKAAQAETSGPSLMSKICAAEYTLEGTGLSAAAARIMALPADEPWPAEKNSKGSKITVNIRPLLLNLVADSPDRLTIRVRAGSKENMRPDLFLNVLASQGGLPALAAADTVITRMRLLIPSESDPGVLESPLPLPDEQ